MEINLPIIIVFLILMVAITALWGLVNYMKGREQVLLLMIKSMGVEANKIQESLKRVGTAKKTGENS